MITPFSIGINLYAYIRDNLERGSTILELGSGAGSRLLAHDYEVICVEHDPDYYLKHEITYIPAEIKNGWYDLTENRIPDYDLLLIDGPPEKIGREGILNNLELFDLSKPVIVDDTHRETEMRIAKAIADAKRTGLTGQRDQHGKEFVTIW